MRSRRSTKSPTAKPSSPSGRTSWKTSSSQRAEVERLAQAEAEDFTPLRDGSDLWKDGVDLHALLGDDGTIDPEAVRATALEIGDRPPPLAQLRSGGEGRPGSGRVTGDADAVVRAALKGRA